MQDEQDLVLKQFDDLIETLEHVVDAETECESYVYITMVRALENARSLYERLEKDEGTRIKRARETVHYADHPGIPVE